MKKTCIIIAGPTAVGKTAIAIQVAKYFSTQIISADSRQCYRELNIGVAKPSPGELAAITHHFINSHSIHDSLSAADFETVALDSIKKIFTGNDIAVMVGGTGLYIKAFCEGLDEISPVPLSIRQDIIKDYAEKGMEWLHQEISRQDPEYLLSGEMQNPQRMMRALEVKKSTGQSIISFRSAQKKSRDFNIIKICIELPRPVLFHRINSRVNEMIEQGLPEEVFSLIPYKELNALQTVGYTELFEYFAKHISLPDAIELIKQNTRRYAKRQITWFKKDPSFTWIEPDINMISPYLQEKLRINKMIRT